MDYRELLINIINSENIRCSLIEDYNNNYEKFLNFLLDIHENIINYLILENLTKNKKWPYKDVQKIFPLNENLKNIFSEFENEINQIKESENLTIFHTQFLNLTSTLQGDFFNFQTEKSQSKFNGAFYTSEKVVKLMCFEAFSHLPSNIDYSTFKV